MSPPSGLQRSPRAHGVLAALTLIYALNFMDRQVINILAQPIKQELQISDAALAFLAGTAFTLVYAVFGIFLGRAADRFNRVGVIALALSFWSVMTAACGLAQGYLQLMLARIGVGLGESGSIPSSQSLISDFYPPHERALAMGVFGMGIPLGSLLGLVIGGAANDAFGWRAAFIIVGLPGLIVAALLYLLLKEPLRGRQDSIDPQRSQPLPSVGETLAILARRKSYWIVSSAAAGGLMLIYVANAWFPAMLIRTMGMKPQEVGLLLGLFTGIGGGVSTFAGGWITDRLRARLPRIELWLPAVTLVLAFPFYLIAVTATDRTVVLCAMAVQFALMYAWLGPTFAVIQRVVPVRVRGMGAALQIGAGAVFAQLLGPQLVGFLSDHYTALNGVTGLRDALLRVSVVCLIGAALFVSAAPFLARDSSADA